MFTRRRTGYRVVRALPVSTVVAELAILRASCTLYVVIRRCFEVLPGWLACVAVTIAPHRAPAAHGCWPESLRPPLHGRDSLL